MATRRSADPNFNADSVSEKLEEDTCSGLGVTGDKPQGRTGLGWSKNNDGDSQRIEPCNKRRHENTSDDNDPTPKKIPRTRRLSRTRKSNADVDNARDADGDINESTQDCYRFSVERLSDLRLQPKAPTTHDVGQASHGVTAIQFMDALTHQVLTELVPEEISIGPNISWEKLVNEVATFNDYQGFRFTGTLYLSPRPEQNFSIRSQAQLNSALNKFPPGLTAIITTQPINVDTQRLTQPTPCAGPLGQQSQTKSHNNDSDLLENAKLMDGIELGLLPSEKIGLTLYRPNRYSDFDVPPHQIPRPETSVSLQYPLGQPGFAALSGPGGRGSCILPTDGDGLVEEGQVSSDRDGTANVRDTGEVPIIESSTLNHHLEDASSNGDPIQTQPITGRTSGGAEQSHPEAPLAESVYSLRTNKSPLGSSSFILDRAVEANAASNDASDLEEQQCAPKDTHIRETVSLRKWNAVNNRNDTFLDLDGYTQHGSTLSISHNNNNKDASNGSNASNPVVQSVLPAKQPPKGNSASPHKSAPERQSPCTSSYRDTIDLTNDSDDDTDDGQAGPDRDDSHEQPSTREMNNGGRETEEEPGESEEEDEDAPEDDKEADTAVIAAAAKHMLSHKDTITAKQLAAKMDITDWGEGAEVWLLHVDELRVLDDEPRVRIPPTVWLSPHYSVYPHQVVGSSALFKTSFGPKRGCILADEMGLGKTDTVILAWSINFGGVVKTMSGVRELEALKFPPVEEGGTIIGVRPRIGATFVSASAQGIGAWPEAWARIMGSSQALLDFPVEWRPKLVILHRDAVTYCKKYGGKDMGLYSAMTPEEWAEVLLQPDWEQSRTPHGHTALRDHNWVAASDWPHSPGATTARPSSTSTRYIIVCTNQSWRGHIACTWNENAAPKAYKDLVNQLNNPHPRKKISSKARAELVQQIDAFKAKYFMQAGHTRDGHGPTQARRRCIGLNAKGKKKEGIRICDLDYAGWVVIDEIHAAASENTITYTELVDRFRRNCPEEAWPSITGITGSPLANGISTTGVFAARILSRKTSEDAVVCALSANFSLPTFMSSWNELLRVFKMGQRIKDKMTRQQVIDKQLATNLGIKRMYKAFALIMQHFLIQRDYQTHDPWGRLLSLIPAKHDVQYYDVTFEDEHHKKLLAAEQAVQAAVNEKWEENVQERRDKGQRGDEPKKPTGAKADPAAYMTARLLASFPNLLDAIRVWQTANPAKPHIIGEDCTWGNNLGRANREVQSALRSEQDIRESFIWEIARDACKGSAKMDYILEQARLVGSQLSCVPHPDAQRRAQGAMHTYKSKYVVVSGIRLARALVWSRLTQEYGVDQVVSVTNAKDRMDAVPRWRNVHGTVWIMVAALGAICQSITLTEGHVLHVLEPTSDNNKATQVANRQYRIGQQHKTVEVKWLLHHGSVIERNIAIGNQCRNAYANGIKGLQVEGSERDEKLSGKVEEWSKEV